MIAASGVIAMTAVAARAAVRAGDLTPVDLVEASIARIEQVDGTINAIPTRCFERALDRARALLARHGAAPQTYPLLAGLPLAVKDNTDVAGVPTSGGSPITAGRIPDLSDPLVARLEAQGGIVIGKSNLSELGGANTTNSVFGPTRHPLDPALTPGGSSGGSAAALAAHAVFLAHGNDVGGSLRTPAAFCGVVGLRPTPGLVPRKPASIPDDIIFVEGPMARTVADAGLMLDALCGYHAGDPLSYEGGGGFLDAARNPRRPGRVAVSPDLGGLPVAAGIREAFGGFVERLAAEGVALEEACPDFTGAPEAILQLRGLSYRRNWGPLWPVAAGRFTSDVRQDIERGLALDASTAEAARRYQRDLVRRVAAFFADFDLLVCPAVQTQPFPVETPWPKEIAGKRLASYVDWIAITYFWSITGCPSMAVPVGADAGGMPVAVQIVGPPRSERRLLAAAAWIEAHAGGA